MKNTPIFNSLKCYPNYTKRLKSICNDIEFLVSAVCSLDCGPNGVCESGKCRCNPGWTGNLCDQLPCDSRCSEHGQCKNGTCVCTQGWNGRHCTLRKSLLIPKTI